jgi:dienelactone hydrolase
MKRSVLVLLLFGVACGSTKTQKKPDPVEPETTVAESEETKAPEEKPKAAGHLYDEPVPITAEEVSFESGEANLRGEIVRPDPPDETARPGIVIVHDWGPHNREGLMAETFGVRLPVEVPVYRTLAESLASYGAVVLIYDKRTCVKGGPPWCEYPRSYVDERPDLATALTEDALAAARTLAERDDVGGVHFLGHGHGSEIAAAASEEADAASVAMLAPTPYALDAIVEFQTKRSIELLREELEKIGDKPTADPLKQQLKELRKQQGQQKEVFEKLRKGETPETDVFGLAPATWKDVLALHDDYLESLQNLEIPVLALVGDVDPGLPDDSNARMETIVRPHGDRAFALVTDLTRFGVGVGEEDDPTTVSPIVVEALVEFFDSRT